MDSYSQTLERIYNLRGGVIDLRLDRMDRALALFGHPQSQYPSFHIAGTNGKGSTAAMLHRILSQAGYRTGLYTSPHLESFTERIRIADRAISPAEVVELAEEVRLRTAAADVLLTFFEFVTVMGLVYFAREKVDVAVVEVGLGGRLDATNLVKPVVSLITTISKDHEAYLGSDLLSIAREKGGIIKSGIPVVVGAVAQEVSRLFKEIAQGQNCQAWFFGQDFKIFLKNSRVFDYTGVKQNFAQLSLGLRGRHQVNNAAVVLAALESMSTEFPVQEVDIREGLKTVQWPGRFELMLEHPSVILDGAHNGEGVSALVAAIEEYRAGRRVKLLFAAMEDKDWRLMLTMLQGVAEEIVLTRVGMERCADPELLAEYLPDRLTHRAIEDPKVALRALIDDAAADDIVLVAGSLYLLGEVRPIVRELAERPKPV